MNELLATSRFAKRGAGPPGVTPVVLAAGAGSRMGCPKALLDLAGRPAIAVVIESCREAECLDPVVVIGAHAPEILRSAGDALRSGHARVIVHGRWREGRTSSLKAGLGGLARESGASAFLLFPVDCPLVAPATIRALIEARGSIPARSRVRIVLPTYEGRRGHPALCDLSLIPEFLELGEDEPANRVMRRDPARCLELPVDDPAVLDDLDTPESVALALGRARTL